MMYNNLRSLDRKIEKLIKKKKYVSYGKMFRVARDFCPLIGDYLILNRVAKLCLKYGKKLNRNMIRTAVTYSEDYNDLSRGEKIVWSKNLVVSAGIK